MARQKSNVRMVICSLNVALNAAGWISGGSASGVRVVLFPDVHVSGALGDGPDAPEIVVREDDFILRSVVQAEECRCATAGSRLRNEDVLHAVQADRGQFRSRGRACKSDQREVLDVGYVNG